MGFSGITAIALCPWGLGPGDTPLLLIREQLKNQTFILPSHGEGLLGCTVEMKVLCFVGQLGCLGPRSTGSRI